MFRACAFALFMFPFASFAQNTIPEHPPAFIPPYAFNQQIPANPNTPAPVANTTASTNNAVAANSLKININTADAMTLDAVLTGIGAKKAQAIVQYRQEFGAFKSPYDLTKVSGIGLKTVENNLSKIIVSDELPVKENNDKTTEVSNVVKR